MQLQSNDLMLALTSLVSSIISLLTSWLTPPPPPFEGDLRLVAWLKTLFDVVDVVLMQKPKAMVAIG